MFVEDQDLLMLLSSLDDCKHPMVVRRYLRAWLSKIDDHVRQYHDLFEDWMVEDDDGLEWEIYWLQQQH